MFDPSDNYFTLWSCCSSLEYRLILISMKCVTYTHIPIITKKYGSYFALKWPLQLWIGEQSTGCVWCECGISASRLRRLGFDQILWINKNMKRKFLELLEFVQFWGKLKGKMMCIKSVLLKGLRLRFRGYILSGHLSEEREALALTFDPDKPASIAARHSHAIQGERGSMPRGWIREHWNSVVRLISYFWSLQATCGVISS